MWVCTKLKDIEIQLILIRPETFIILLYFWYSFKDNSQVNNERWKCVNTKFFAGVR